MFDFWSLFNREIEVCKFSNNFFFEFSLWFNNIWMMKINIIFFLVCDQILMLLNFNLFDLTKSLKFRFMPTFPIFSYFQNPWTSSTKKSLDHLLLLKITQRWCTWHKKLIGQLRIVKQGINMNVGIVVAHIFILLLPLWYI